MGIQLKTNVTVRCDTYQEAFDSMESLARIGGHGVSITFHGHTQQVASGEYRTLRGAFVMPFHPSHLEEGQFRLTFDSMAYRAFNADDGSYFEVTAAVFNADVHSMYSTFRGDI